LPLPQSKKIKLRKERKSKKKISPFPTDF